MMMGSGHNIIQMSSEVECDIDICMPWRRRRVDNEVLAEWRLAAWVICMSVSRETSDDRCFVMWPMRVRYKRIDFLEHFEWWFVDTRMSNSIMQHKHHHHSLHYQSLLNLDLKLFCSIRLLLNTDPTCHQRLWSYRNSIMIINVYVIISHQYTHKV